MKITYIHHSSFLVETENACFLFDYYKGKLPALNPEKQLFVLASHKHPDHFDACIFNTELLYPSSPVKGIPTPVYLLASDIRMNEAYMDRKDIPKSIRPSIHFLKKNDLYEVPTGTTPLTVETLTSTDAGVAFIINYNGKQIYHAGDLNWWTWNGEDTEQEKDMERRYTGEIDKIKNRSFDAAFLPLDPRQENRFYLGFDYFMRTVDVKAAFPMHFWGDYSVIRQLMDLDCSVPYRDKIISLSHEGQEFDL